MGSGIFERYDVGISRMPLSTVFPVALTSGFPRMLSTSVPIGRLQKQLSVALIFPIEKFPL